MKITQHIEQAKGKTLFSIEVLPPKKGEDIQSLFKAIEPLTEFGLSFIDVTYSREEYIYRQREDGLIQKVVTRKRPSTIAICAAIQNNFKIDAIPHLICGGFSREETENALIDCQFLGIDNVLALRGDAMKSDSSFIPHPEGHHYASDLIQQIQNLNNGKYLYDIEHSLKSDFCIGAAAYPEKHFEAPNLMTDLAYLKNKVDLGAEYIVTQMFFDNQKYFDFVDLCRANDINVPIIPGLKPLATKKQLTVLPSIFHMDIPEVLVKEINACKDNTQVKEVGIEWAIQQSKELQKAGVPSLHYYTMSRSAATKKIAEAVF